MSDRIFLSGMSFEGRHGVSDEERSETQVIEMDVEYELDLREAGTNDDLALTVSYSDVFEICRAQVEQRSYHLLEAIAEGVAADILGEFERVTRVAVTVRKPGVPIDGVLEYAGVRIEREREL
jgi:dihydroneopterin aldolase